VVGHIVDAAGIVEIAADGLSGTPATDQSPVRSGESLLTKGADARAAIRLDDGTVISLAGDTRVAFPADDQDRVDMEYGNVTAARAKRGWKSWGRGYRSRGAIGGHASMCWRAIFASHGFRTSDP
jgi:hypothetical protein